MGPPEDLIAAIRKMPRDAFARLYPYPFLVRNRDAQEVGETDWRKFTTELVSSGTARGVPVHPDDRALLARCEFLAVRKKGDNPWADRISLGRARNSDIMVDHHSVSKLHAHFWPEGDFTYVSDAGSRNGTRVGNAKLTATQRVRLVAGEAITFGSITMTFVNALGLHDLLRAMAAQG